MVSMDEDKPKAIRLDKALRDQLVNAVPPPTVELDIIERIADLPEVTIMAEGYYDTDPPDLTGR